SRLGSLSRWHSPQESPSEQRAHRGSFEFVSLVSKSLPIPLDVGAAFALGDGVVVNLPSSRFALAVQVAMQNGPISVNGRSSVSVAGEVPPRDYLTMSKIVGIESKQS